MGWQLSKGEVGGSIPTMADCVTGRASSDVLQDGRLASPSSPAKKSMFPASADRRLEGESLLTGEEQNLGQQARWASSIRDNHRTKNEADATTPPTMDGSIWSARLANMESQNMGRFYADTDEPSETTALLTSGSALASQGTSRVVGTLEAKSEADHEVGTSWKQEFLVLTKNSLPLMLTCILQYSLNGASVISVGHLGKTELAAVSLATMTANVTGYVTYAGLATSLDTLCAQAYGSGKAHLVGLHVQRMVFFLWFITIPIAAIWWYSTQILLWITPEPECAELAGLFLKILVLGAPGFAMFEAGKRFVQAQGLFNANMYVLLICAPLNAFMNWLFVWRFRWGFVGAPIAVAITNNLLPLCLWLYVYFVDGLGCWNGLTRQALHNWYPMVRLAVPGYVMVVSEFIAFEILTLSSSHISTTALAAQSVLNTLSVITFQIPFSVSVAASTRLANLIGAGLPASSQACVHVTLAMACGAGVFNIVVLTTFRDYIPRIYTSDAAVTHLILEVLPLFAAFQLFDALVANCSGVLRGMGRQYIGGWVNLVCYYGIAIPVSLEVAFGLRWGLFGLWIGPAVGIFLVSTIDWWFIYQSNWTKIIEAASLRNESGSC